jgi:hypothetical protein
MGRRSRGSLGREREREKGKEGCETEGEGKGYRKGRE